MEYNFVQAPHVGTATARALAHRDFLKNPEDSTKKLFISLGGWTPEDPLSYEETQVLQQHDQQWAEFTNHHYFFEETISDAQRISYIVGHRGGDEFPGVTGAANYEELASGVLSQLRAGTYKRGSGAAYSLADFEKNVRGSNKGKLKSGWLRKE